MARVEGIGPILAVTGLKAEAKIAAGPGVTTLAGGGDAARLALLLQGYLASGATAVISFGIAGGLAPGLPAGTIVVADGIDDGETFWAADAHWRNRLLGALPGAVPGRLAGVDAAVAGAVGKAALHARSRAVAVDMESHIAARLAALHRLPFAALRVIADPAERSLPQAALVGMRPDGTTDVGAVLKALARKPADLPALVHTALDARAAFMSLKASRNQLSPLFGFPDGQAKVQEPEFDPTMAPAEAGALAFADGTAETA